jgi:hypothetical protein
MERLYSGDDLREANESKEACGGPLGDECCTAPRMSLPSGVLRPAISENFPKWPLFAAM